MGLRHACGPNALATYEPLPRADGRPCLLAETLAQSVSAFFVRRDDASRNLVDDSKTARHPREPAVSIEPAMLAFAVVVCAGYAVQTATGFGSMLICVTFGAHLLGIESVIRLVVPISFLQTGYIVVRHHDGILWPLLLRRVLPLMIAGMVFAFLFLSGVGSAWLGLAFGLMVLILSARELQRLRLAHPASREKPIARPKSIAALFGAGVVHGVYATGGPLLVYALGREGIDKKSFRSTLSVVWIVLNAILITRFSLAGDYEASMLADLLVLLPTVPMGIVAGEWIHHRFDERRFKAAVFLLLVAASISLILRYTLKLF